jgi:hypothetical protein
MTNVAASRRAAQRHSANVEGMTKSECRMLVDKTCLAFVIRDSFVI